MSIIQTAAGRLGNHQGNGILLKEHDQADFFASDYGSTNGLKFFPDVAQNHWNLDGSKQTKCFENGNGVNSKLEHADTNGDEKGWNVKDVNGSLVQQVICFSSFQISIAISIFLLSLYLIKMYLYAL